MYIKPELSFRFRRLENFFTNKEKSRLVPNQSFQWLGVMWDSPSGMMSLPQVKIESCSKDLQSFLVKFFILRKQLMRFQGRLLLASLVDPIEETLQKFSDSFSASISEEKGWQIGCYHSISLSRSLSWDGSGQGSSGQSFFSILLLRCGTSSQSPHFKDCEFRPRQVWICGGGGLTLWVEFVSTS